MHRHLRGVCIKAAVGSVENTRTQISEFGLSDATQARGNGIALRVLHRRDVFIRGGTQDIRALLRIQPCLPHIAQHLIATFGAEKPDDKEAFIKEIVSGDVDPTESQTLTDRNVIIDRDTAVVVGTDTERGTKKGAAYTVVYRYTVTYIRRNGRWIALAEHLVEGPQGK